MSKKKNKKNKKQNHLSTMQEWDLLNMEEYDDIQYEIELPEDALSFTDLELRKLVKEKFEELEIYARYNPEEDAWYLFDGLVWMKDKKNKQMLESIMQIMQEEYEIQLQTATTPDDIKKWYAYTSQTIAKKILSVLEQDKDMQETRFDRIVDEITVKNGIVDLRTGKLSKANPWHFHTKKIDINYDVTYTKKTEYKKSRFYQMLEEVLVLPNQENGEWIPDEPKIKFLQTFFGYCLTGETREQKFMILLGNGGNGKSLLLNTISALLGNFALTLPIGKIVESHESDRDYYLEKTVGKRLIVTSECKITDTLDESFVKNITGESKLMARQIRQEPVEFTPHFKMLMDTNYLPNISGNYAISRRLIIVKFNRTFKENEVNVELEQILKSTKEQEAALAWMVKGAKRYYNDGLEIPQEIIQETESLIYANNSAELFVHKIEQTPGAMCLAGKLYGMYVDFCKANALTAQTQMMLAKKLENAGFTKNHKREGTMYLNIDAESLHENLREGI